MPVVVSPIVHLENSTDLSCNCPPPSGKVRLWSSS